MPFFDLPQSELVTYKPDRNEPDDFDQFWDETLATTREYDLNATFEPVDVGLAIVDVFDVTYAGYSGQPIKGWFLRPKGVNKPLPCVVEFIGYGGGRGLPLNWLHWAAAGYAHLVMDTRGQGGSWLHGDTPDIPDGGNPSAPGFMTQGILNPKSYYYRRVYTDAVRAVEAARSHDGVDSERIAVTGGSQGGGITIAVSGLVPDVAFSMPDVPFLCHFERAIGLTDKHPYAEIVKYLSIQRDKVGQVYRTLGYFDGMNFAARSQAHALFSVGLMDPICPPSTVYATYNQIDAPKSIAIYPFNEHEGGQIIQSDRKIRFLNEHWGDLR